MFTLAKNPNYWWPVVINSPGDDGKVVSSQFDGLFKRFSQTEHQALVDKIRGQTREKPYTDADMAREVMVGWRGVNAPDGSSIEFTDGTFAQLLDLLGLGTAICKAFDASLKKAAEKN